MNNNTISKHGIVAFRSTAQCTVLVEGKEILSQISKKMKIVGEQKNSPFERSSNARGLENLLVVGDRVSLMCDGTGLSMITERYPRKNQISRRSSSTRMRGEWIEQVLASNVDQVVIVFAAANPEPKWNLLDRYLVMAESVELPVVIIITKIDLVEGEAMTNDLNQELAVYQKIGYPVISTSSKQQQGIAPLFDALKGKTSLMIGKSGVGKTSLLNSLMPNKDFHVNDVNEITGKGRHTTTAMHLIPVDENTLLIDSPGTREFGVWDVEPEDLDWYFPEMRPYLGTCKYKLDCQHEEEPGCAVRKAVVNHQINPRRYQSYLRLKEEFLS